MSGSITRERPAINMGGWGALAGEPQPQGEQLPALRPVGQAVDNAMAHVVTAQRVAIKRDIGRVLQEIEAASNAAGERFYYSIPFKNKRSGTTDLVEGISIKGAMAVASIYGNCSVEAVIANETAVAWIFAARFIDYEKGITITRLFQQRKNQSSGMADAGRQLDIVFQIGQSKAMRNVVEAALPLFTEHAFEAAKNTIRTKISNKPEDYRKRLVAWFEERGVPLQRVERLVGRPSGRWTNADMAKLYVEVCTVNDRMAEPDDFWPAPESDDAPAATSVDPEPQEEAQQAGEQQQEEAAPAAEEKAATTAPQQQEEVKAAPTEEAKPKAEAKPAAAKKAKEADDGLNFGG